MVKVTIDKELCRGHHMCTLGAYDIFVVGDDDEGRAEVTSEDQPDDRLEDILKAAESCPEQAIKVVR